MTSLADRYAGIQKRISKAVTLIAVSKRQSVEAIQSLYLLGQRDFGENYVQELCTKAEELKLRGYTDIRWHFIGHLQTNKVKALVKVVSVVHTVDSLKLARELAKRWTEAEREGQLPIFIEVNVDLESSKAGVPPNEVSKLVDGIREIPELSLQGLMCIPETGQDPGSRFVLLSELEKQFRPVSLGMLSMGMSGDFELAIQKGSTHVRVGTAIFGER